MPTPDCDSEYVLWCLVEDDDRPFPVLISRTSHVFHLKELVLTMVTSGPYRDANAKDIILMKVRHIMSFTFTGIADTHLSQPNGRSM